MSDASSDENEEEEQPRDLEIVGLMKSSNGRSCTSHTCCGKTLDLNQVLHLVQCVVEIDNQTEDAVKCICIEDGSEGCTVGFVPKYLLFNKEFRARFNKTQAPLVQVVQLYQDSHSKHKCHKSYSNFGMASCVYFDDVPIGE